MPVRVRPSAESLAQSMPSPTVATRVRSLSVLWRTLRARLTAPATPRAPATPAHTLVPMPKVTPFKASSPAFLKSPCANAIPASIALMPSAMPPHTAQPNSAAVPSPSFAAFHRVLKSSFPLIAIDAVAKTEPHRPALVVATFFAARPTAFAARLACFHAALAARLACFHAAFAARFAAFHAFDRPRLTAFLTFLTTFLVTSLTFRLPGGEVRREPQPAHRRAERAYRRRGPVAVPANSSNTWAAARWAHLDGVAGYVFPYAGKLLAQRLERTGSYRSITSDGSTTPITRRYLTLWHDHGVDPSNARYAYLVIPHATTIRTAQLADQPEVALLANSGTAQAVRQSRTGITMVNFWSAGTVGNITVNKVSGVIVQESAGTLKIGVAEPYRSGNTIRVSVTPASGPYRLLRKDPEVTVVSTGTTIVLDVSPGTYVRTRTAEFTL